ncbi:unnamed protein product [Didymodactylos carnosus]|uniref:EGF-like domain-containing protein n=1 Tax=Didymodactylos carnosus TaxID=1234261 RepID=A0A815ARK7_9BILA|nr:unnamed protein product [Didymodactylos carnosus]CAF4038307.1 unnamed protein product [Didymodactylos carnosus]
MLTQKAETYFVLVSESDKTSEDLFSRADDNPNSEKNTNMKMNNINNIYSAVPYYIRSLTRLISQQQLCYGNEIRFSDLKLLNITIQNLYVWHSPIEILNNYGKYLVAPDGSSVNDEQIYSGNNTCVKQSERCDGINKCICADEDEWFCDLIQKNVYKYFTFDGLNQYPSLFTNYDETTKEPNTTSCSRNIPLHSKECVDCIFKLDLRELSYYCNRSILIQSKNIQGITCFCSPAYYGNICQFQHKRVSIHLQVEIFKFYL